MILTALHGINESLQFVEVALWIDLVVRKYWSEVVAGVEVFDGFVVRMNFLDGNAEDGGGFEFKGQFFHLREAVDTFWRAEEVSYEVEGMDKQV